MTEGAYHADNPSLQTYWRTPTITKTDRRSAVTCHDGILRVLLVPHAADMADTMLPSNAGQRDTLAA